MSNPKITDEEKQITLHWFTKAERFLALIRGHAENCKRRTCKGVGMCFAESLNETSERNACGLPLDEGDVAQTIQLALFGMMLEEGLLNNPEEPAH